MKSHFILFILTAALFSSCQKKKAATAPPVVTPVKPDSVVVLPVVTPAPIPPYTDTFYGDVREGDFYPAQTNPVVATIHVYAFHDTNNQVIFSSESFHSAFFDGNFTCTGTFQIDSTNYYSVVIMDPNWGDYYNFKLSGKSLIYNESHSYRPNFDLIYYIGDKIKH